MGNGVALTEIGCVDQFEIGEVSNRDDSSQDLERFRLPQKVANACTGFLIARDRGKELISAR
jgi:hypothetical protein